DRYHAKQGRSTARVVFHAPGGSLSVYPKRHFRLPWHNRLASLVDPDGAHSPAAVEWQHLERVRALGLAVPAVVAAGGRIGRGGRLGCFATTAGRAGPLPLHGAPPAWRDRLDPRTFAAWKRRAIAGLAMIAATLHRASLFHKDLYLCHFFAQAPGRECAETPA